MSAHNEANMAREERALVLASRTSVAPDIPPAPSGDEGQPVDVDADLNTVLRVNDRHAQRLDHWEITSPADRQLFLVVLLSHYLVRIEVFH